MLKIFSHIAIGIFLSIFLLINTGFCFNPHQVEKESESNIIHSEMSCCASETKKEDNKQDACCKKLDSYTKDSRLSIDKNNLKFIFKKNVDFIYVQYPILSYQLEIKSVAYSPPTKSPKTFLYFIQLIRI